VKLSRASSITYPYNPPDAGTAFANAPLYPAGGVLIKIGAAVAWRRYEVQSAQLSATDLVSGVRVPIADNVVSLQSTVRRDERHRDRHYPLGERQR
jgi:hypothetical protein